MKIQLKFAAIFMLATVLAFTACGGGSGEDSKSGAKAITAFSFTSPAAMGIINEVDHTIAITVWGAVTALVPTITHTGASINPATGVANDFTGAQTYTVTAADGSTQAYMVTVTIKEYDLRDVGPAGGWIFYINPNAATDGWKYLEAAPVDQTSRKWGTYGLTVPGADGTAIGTGKQNTLDIIDGDTLENKAADGCANYSNVSNGISYDDWFLPSQDELNLMYTALKLQGVGNFTDDFYFSSSETDGNWAKDQYFGDGGQSSTSKFFSLGVRAARSF
jgi:hypothetical protein